MSITSCLMLHSYKQGVQNEDTPFQMSNNLVDNVTAEAIWAEIEAAFLLL